ncbi:MAG: iron hydrogenase small subunit [Eggerthellaceae bacterium]|nr:iron hydrogenase small subunit [Eggerthellaceae bacterium]
MSRGQALPALQPFWHRLSVRKVVSIVRNVTAYINGQEICVASNTTIIEAARENEITIPSLCYLKEINDIAACRMCVVEVEGVDRLLSSCNNFVEEGMRIVTNSLRVLEARKANIELLLSKHDTSCTSCLRSGNCMLQSLSESLNITEVPLDIDPKYEEWEDDFPLVRNSSKCIKCGRCVAICDKVQNIGAWKFSRTGLVEVNGLRKLSETDCSLCGQCITHCPVGALTARDDTMKVLAAINDRSKKTAVQVAPAVRTAWAEHLDLKHYEASPERMVSALREIGFDYVFDTDWAADLTIIEEVSEFVDRLSIHTQGERQKFPMFTSCCPGWVRHIKATWPDYVDQLSTAKSPQQMFGSMCKTYFAEKVGIDPAGLVCISVMPCVAKKHECKLPNLSSACAGQDVDISITTREFVRILCELNIDITQLDETPFDSPLGESTGAGTIFGASGGVMEAALRSSYSMVTGENPPDEFFHEVRARAHKEGESDEDLGLVTTVDEKGIERHWREAAFELEGNEIKVAVANGLGNTDALMAAIDSGEKEYHFVEVMACPTGCSGGGGQPIFEGCELGEDRGGILYSLDKCMKLRNSHENPSVQVAYTEFLEKPCSHKAHKLLHSDHHAWHMPHK